VYGVASRLDLKWNARYQVTEVFTNGIAVERNGFDALGRRVWNWDGSTTNYMVYDGVHVLAEVDSTGGLKRAYTHGPGVDNWLAMTCYTGTTAKTYFYMTDVQGTVHAVADETGSIVESYRFDAWGRVLGVYNGAGTPIAESAIGNKILWQGREYSWKTGLYFFRARWYDPITGRWLSNDPIGIAGGLNQYVFCSNNPVNFRDPSGLCKDESGPWKVSDAIRFFDKILLATGLIGGGTPHLSKEYAGHLGLEAINLDLWDRLADEVENSGRRQDLWGPNTIFNKDVFTQDAWDRLKERFNKNCERLGIKDWVAPRNSLPTDQDALDEWLFWDED
jgi:RHS repeat-associated protein